MWQSRIIPDTQPNFGNRGVTMELSPLFEVGPHRTTGIRLG